MTALPLTQVNELLEELERMRFECEGGALVNAWAWRRLREALSVERQDTIPEA